MPMVSSGTIPTVAPSRTMTRSCALATAGIAAVPAKTASARIDFRMVVSCHEVKRRRCADLLGDNPLHSPTFLRHAGLHCGFFVQAWNQTASRIVFDRLTRVRNDPCHSLNFSVALFGEPS